MEAKRAFLRFTLKKTCCICNSLIGDRVIIYLYRLLSYIQTQMYAIKPVWEKIRTPTQSAQLQSKISRKHSNTEK